MKKIFILLLLGLFLGGCGDDSAKCDNKIALETLGNLLKNGISNSYNSNFSYESYNKKILQNRDIIRQSQNDFRLYLDKDVKIKFSNFRTQKKDEFSCGCTAKIEFIFPEPPDSVRTTQEIYAELRGDGFWEGNQFIANRYPLNLSFLSQGLQTTFNETKEIDDVIYFVTLTDDKKQVYTRFVNIGMGYLK